MVLCGTSWSYETASTVLKRLTDASVCAKTIQSLMQRSANPVKANAVKTYETAKRKAIKTEVKVQVKKHRKLNDGSKGVSRKTLDDFFKKK